MGNGRLLGVRDETIHEPYHKTKRGDKVGYHRDRARWLDDSQEVLSKQVKILAKDGVWHVGIKERPLGWESLGVQDR